MHLVDQLTYQSIAETGASAWQNEVTFEHLL